MSRVGKLLDGLGLPGVPDEGAIQEDATPLIQEGATPIHEAPPVRQAPNLALTPRERAIANQMAAAFDIDPETYIALPVQLMVDQSRPGQIAPMQTPNGVVEMVIVPFVMVLPKANLKMSTVLLADGNAPDPLLGMLPTLEGRLVLPEGRLQPKVLEALKNNDNGAN